MINIRHYNVDPHKGLTKDSHLNQNTSLQIPAGTFTVF